jgi:hypothetical protein
MRYFLIYRYRYPEVGVGIQKTNGGIGIPAFVISIRYRTKKCRTVMFLSGTGPVPASSFCFGPVPD